MEERIKSFLESHKELEEKIPIFKEAFIKFYGEESRKEIEELFEKAIFIGYQDPDSIRFGVDKLLKDKSNDLINQFINNSNTTLSRESLLDTYTLDYPNLHPINRYKELRELFYLQEDGRENTFKEWGYSKLKEMMPSFTQEEYDKMYESKELLEQYESYPNWLKGNIQYCIDKENIKNSYLEKYKKAEPLLKKIVPGITEENFEEYFSSNAFQELDRIVVEYDKVMEEYNSYKKGLKPYQAEIDNNKRVSEEIKEKYYKVYLQENIDLVNDSYKQEVKDYIEGKIHDYNLNSYIQKLFGYDIFGTSLLDAFAEDKDILLRKDDSREWERKEIKKRRIDYFKRNGIDLGEDYNAYLENEEVKRIWPDPERIKKYQKSKEEIINKYNHDYYTSTESCKRIMKKLEGYQFLDYTNPFDERLFLTGSTFVSPNIIEKDGYHELIPMVVISFDDYDTDHKDHHIVHELNHLVELYLDSVSTEEYHYFCGWDDITENLYQDNDDAFVEDKREYELFNEIINEKIAIEISKQMKEDNQNVFDDPNNSTYEHTTSYEYSSFLIDSFYEEFKDDILKSRRNGKIEVIWNAVGKDNFDDLNNLFSIYYENFSGFKIYSLWNALKSKKDTESTRVYYDLIDQRDRILDKMRLHKSMQMESEKQVERL